MVNSTIGGGMACEDAPCTLLDSTIVDHGLICTQANGCATIARNTISFGQPGGFDLESTIYLASSHPLIENNDISAPSCPSVGLPATYAVQAVEL